MFGVIGAMGAMMRAIGLVGRRMLHDCLADARVFGWDDPRTVKARCAAVDVGLLTDGGAVEIPA